MFVFQRHVWIHVLHLVVQSLQRAKSFLDALASIFPGEYALAGFGDLHIRPLIISISQILPLTTSILHTRTVQNCRLVQSGLNNHASLVV